MSTRDGSTEGQALACPIRVAYRIDAGTRCFDGDAAIGCRSSRAPCRTGQSLPRQGGDGDPQADLPRVLPSDLVRRVHHPKPWSHGPSDLSGVSARRESLARRDSSPGLPEVRPGVRERLEGPAPLPGMSGRGSLTASRGGAARRMGERPTTKTEWVIVAASILLLASLIILEVRDRVRARRRRW